MKKLTTLEIKNLDTLNESLVEIEKTIYEIALKQNKSVLKKMLCPEENIQDYELQVNYYFCDNGKKLLAHWSDNIKPIMKRKNGVVLMTTIVITLPRHFKKI